MEKSFISVLTEFFTANDKKLLDQPERFKSLFLDFSQNEYRAEAQIFSQFLASKQAQELKSSNEVDATFLKATEERFHKAYLFDKSTCEMVVKAYAFLMGAIDKKTFKTSMKKTPVRSTVIEQSAPDNMVLINGGTFMMGSPESEPKRREDELLHKVTVSSFYIGKYAVTQKEWYDIMKNNPSYIPFYGNGYNPSFPVNRVSWYDAVDYCNALSRLKELTPAYMISGTDITWDQSANGYRLPTEAEWEYACRAGTTSAYNTGISINNGQANFSEGFFLEAMQQVGLYAPNPWGLYDMHGNVFKWCWDWYGGYSNWAETNPVGHSSGIHRVNRGGSWHANMHCARSAYRNHYEPSLKKRDLGFRLARNVEQGAGV